MLKLLTFILLCAPAIASPHIAAVTSAADFTRGVALGGLGTAFGTGLADSALSASSLPLPIKLGQTEAFICLPGKLVDINPAACEPIRLVFVSPTQINFLLFDALPVKPGFGGMLSLVVRVAGVIDDGATNGNSAGVEVTFSNYGSNGSFIEPQPRVFFIGYDCFTDTRFQDANKTCGLSSLKPKTYAADRGAVSDTGGRVLTSANPARIGQYYTIWMTGLGPFVNGKPRTPLTMALTNQPIYGTDLGNIGLAVSPSFIGPSPEFPGLYQVNFQLPDKPFPCGEHSWEVSIDIRQSITHANLIQIPVQVKSGEVTCH